MTDQEDLKGTDADGIEIARRWCASKGAGWEVLDTLGRGGTAPVFVLKTPNGERAFKILDKKFCDGELGEVSERRINQQVQLGDHDCPYLVKIYDGGRFEGRLFLLMSRAPGRELEKCLQEVPRAKIRRIVDQIARACLFLRSKELCHRDVKSANIFVSDDFEHSTLLDLSVTRAINDPVGIGTDHNGQLPVVATSRYSPPEYLFRLVEPSPSLWHALDVYQLGGLLHDLIMREPLFQSEYELSQENRYRFAWIVATVDPVVSAADVDQDLILLAARALDKKHGRRAQIRLEDFLNEAAIQQAHGLEAFGLSSVKKKPKPGLRATGHQHINEIAKALEDAVLNRLRIMGITAKHAIAATNTDTAKQIDFKWDLSRDSAETLVHDIRFRLRIELEMSSATSKIGLSASLAATTASGFREELTDLPGVPDDADAVEALTAQSLSVLGDLAARVLRAAPESKGE